VRIDTAFPEIYPETQKRPKTDLVGKPRGGNTVAQAYGMLVANYVNKVI